MMGEVIKGDSVEEMRGMAAASVDSCVTDPPYEFGFMGKRWDAQGIAYSVEMWREVYRVLKDGSRLLAFGGPRTNHRMVCAIEDAGFIIEDCIMWIYGQGFPKHKSKLKPAYEPICVARKGRASELNIDACRIGTDEVRPKDSTRAPYSDFGTFQERGGGTRSTGSGANHPAGRWPANVILDEEAGRLLDEQSGQSGGNYRVSTRAVGFRSVKFSGRIGKGELSTITAVDNYGDTGGASRFFYCPKASRAERNAGLEGMTGREVSRMNTHGGSEEKGEAWSPVDDRTGERRDRFKSVQQNHHPTVKPIALMRYLCRLVTPDGGLILDPFAGSGSTGVAALREGFRFVGIEREAEYVEIARRRMAEAEGRYPLFEEQAARFA